MIPRYSGNSLSNPHPVAPRAGCGNKAGNEADFDGLHDACTIGFYPRPISRIRCMGKPATRTEQTPTPTEPANYEQALSELEGLVSAMESAQLPLDDLLKSYRRGAQLLQFCR